MSAIQTLIQIDFFLSLDHSTRLRIPGTCKAGFYWEYNTLAGCRIPFMQYVVLVTAIKQRTAHWGNHLLFFGYVHNRYSAVPIPFLMVNICTVSLRGSAWKVIGKGQKVVKHHAGALLLIYKPTPVFI